MKGRRNAVLFIAACSVFVGGAFGAACYSDKKGSETDHVHSYDLTCWYSDGNEHWRQSTCGHNVTQSYAHEYDGEDKTVCSVCGYVRHVPADYKTGNDEPDGGEDTPDDGEDMPDGGEDTPDGGEDTPDDGEDMPDDGEDMPDDGEDTPDDGEDMPDDGEDNNDETKPTEDENPLVEMRFKNGVTEQLASQTDKISPGWVFEGVRENGESEELPANTVIHERLDTLSVGKHSVAVSCGELSCVVEYTILPRPDVVTAVEVSLKESVNTVIEGDYLTIGTDDFNVVVSADGAYSLIDSWLIYGGQTAKEIILEAREQPHSVTFAVRFEYAVDGETVTEDFFQTVEVHVESAAGPDLPDPEPEPEPDPETPAIPDLTANDNLIIDETVMDSLSDDEEMTVASSDAGSIMLVKEEGIAVTVESFIKTVEGESYPKTLAISFEAGMCYTGIRFSLSRAAAVNLILSSTAINGFGIAELGDDINLITEPVSIDGEGIRYTCELEAGDYCLFILDEEGADFYIHFMEIIFN